MAEQARGTRVAVIAVGLAVAAGAAWWLGSGERAGGRGRRAPESPPVEITPRAAGRVGWSIASGRTVAISRSDLPPRGPVLVDLDPGEVSATPEAGAEPLTGRILSFDESRPDRERRLRGALVGDDRGATRVEIPAAFLKPGLYLIEMKTHEKSHFPMRRYRLEVR